MALIECKECGGTVSSKAYSCPHCGCPISKNNSKTITYKGKTFKVDSIVAQLKAGKRNEAYCDIVEDICLEIEPYDPSDADTIMELICEQHDIRNPQVVNVPRCPTCGSTNIEAIDAFVRGAALGLFGVASKTARSQFCCKNCGYKW